MRSYTFESWSDFRGTLKKRYFERPRERRDQLWFRGHATTTHQLETTLDRVAKASGQFQNWSNVADREAHYQRLLQEFQLEALRCGATEVAALEGIALELVARHSELPSPYLDWTTSPFIASFFAFQNCHRHETDCITVWMLDLARLPDELDKENLVDSSEMIRYNQRALQQQGAFLRVPFAQTSVETFLELALTRFDIKKTDARLVLTELDEMGITATRLFADLPAAATTATMRVNEFPTPREVDHA